MGGGVDGDEARVGVSGVIWKRDLPGRFPVE